MNRDGRQSDDILVEDELVHHMRKIAKELSYIVDLGFCRFWAYIVKFPIFIEFLDDFLQNMRKYNDLEKIQIDLDQSLNDSKLSTSGPETQRSLKKEVNKALRSTFKIFYRLSQSVGSETEYFSLEFYRGLLAQSHIFDMAKLLDIAAIYG